LGSASSAGSRSGWILRRVEARSRRRRDPFTQVGGWGGDYHDFIAYACTRVTRDLTIEERALYGIGDSEPTCPQFAPPVTFS